MQQGADRVAATSAQDQVLPTAPGAQPDRRDEVLDDASARSLAPRQQDESQLRQWLTDLAVRQWAWAFGQPVSPWGYYYGDGGEVLVARATNAVGEPGPAPSPTPEAPPTGLRPGGADAVVMEIGGVRMLLAPGDTLDLTGRDADGRRVLRLDVDGVPIVIRPPAKG